MSKLVSARTVTNVTSLMESKRYAKEFTTDVDGKVRYVLHIGEVNAHSHQKCVNTHMESMNYRQKNM